MCEVSIVQILIIVIITTDGVKNKITYKISEY